MKFFVEEFAGTLVSDFWGAYNAVVCARRQTCLVHLLREGEHTERSKSPGPHWAECAKKLRRLLAEAIRLCRAQADLPEQTYASRRGRLRGRLQELFAAPWKDRHAQRLSKRRGRHQNASFTFLDHPDVPFDNNTAKRGVRPSVIICKNSYGNRSQRGADCQSVLRSVFGALNQRGHHPIRTITEALAS